ncbi:MAG: P-loop NTPase [Nanoarchaeota archaeon]|nr:P-loop NTPase [Nanoarchaeota archaeon]
MTRILHITGHAGAGKSMVAVNLAAALQKQGKKVMLVDSNLYSPAVAHYCGVDFQTCINDHIEGKASLEEISHLHECGMTILPAAPQEHEADLEAMNKVLLGLVGKADIVVVDSFSHSPLVTHVVDAADESFFVTTDDFHSILSSRDLIRHLESKGAHISGVILNEKRAKTDRRHIQAVLGKQVISEIPRDERLIDYADDGKIACLHTTSGAAGAIIGLAKTLL